MADFKAKAQRLIEEYDEEDAQLGRAEGVVKVGKVKEVQYAGGKEVDKEVDKIRADQ